MKKVQYTGLNYNEIREFSDNRILAPYECMGFSMLSMLTDEGYITVNEGDWVCKDDDGKLSIE